jgi:hypothetical protein
MEWIGRGIGCKDVVELYCSHYYFHGTSSAMDGLADKDEFVRTMKRHHCEYLSPPTILIDWDATESYCRSVRFPTLREIESSPPPTTTMLNEFATANHTNDKHAVAVLKLHWGVEVRVYILFLTRRNFYNMFVKIIFVRWKKDKENFYYKYMIVKDGFPRGYCKQKYIHPCCYCMNRRKRNFIYDPTLLL